MAEKSLKPFDSAINVSIVFYRPIQKSISKIEKMRRHYGVVLPAVKPDIDNFVKSAFDAFNGALWTDDNLITDMNIKKRYSLKPRIVVKIVESKRKPPIKCVKNKWYYVQEDGTLKPVWSDEENEKTDLS